MKIYLVGEAATLRYALFPLSELHCYLRRAATAIKKPDIEKKGTLNGYLFFSMPGNLVTHRQCLRTRGSVQSAFLFCCRLFLCVSMAGCSVVGSSPADWGTITQVYLNNLSTVGTLQLNDARSGSHFIKNAPVAFRATLYNFDFIRVRFHSIRSSSSISTRTKL